MRIEPPSTPSRPAGDAPAQASARWLPALHRACARCLCEGRHGLRAPHRLPGRLLRALRRVAPLLARGRPPRAPPRRPRPQGRWVTLPFLYLGPSRPIDAMEYHTPFPVFLGLAGRSRMIATTARYGRDHAKSSGTTEKRCETPWRIPSRRWELSGLEAYS